MIRYHISISYDDDSPSLQHKLPEDERRPETPTEDWNMSEEEIEVGELKVQQL